MIILVITIILFLCGLYVVGKAETRAQAIIAGAKRSENPNWFERLAISAIPLIIEKNQKRKLRGEIVSTPTSHVDYSREAVNERLEIAFNGYLRKEINIWDYKDIVTQEESNLRYRIEDLRESKWALPRSSEMRQFYDDDIDDVRDALEETKWRLGWIKERETDPIGDGYYSG